MELLSECSTPFGITEVGILGYDTPRYLDKCSAQRLSASQRWAYRGLDGRQSAQREVLNAFRHHRGGHTVTAALTTQAKKCSTPFGITEVGI